MPRNSIDVSQFPIVPNPWGINRRGAALLDRYIGIGDMSKAAAAPVDAPGVGDDREL